MGGMILNFKVGQTVEVVNNDGMSALIGATAVVKSVRSKYIYVVWKTKSRGQMDGGYWPYLFKPVFTKNEQLLFSFMSAVEGT